MSVTRAGLTKSVGRIRADRRPALGELVEADVGIEPPLVALLVDLALRNDEARVQPSIRRGLGRELHAGEDRAPARVLLLHALAVDGDEQITSVACRDHATKVGRPHTV